ncbi:MAG: ribonuclease HII [Oscillospiraceae bacterium]
MSLWEVENLYREKGYTAICGCDEAGAGPLAGPVYAAAVILPFGVDIPGLNDSKQLTEKMREALFPIIQETAVAWAIASVSAQEIDATDILTARMKAMDLAISQLSPQADFALIDGNRDHGRGSAITLAHQCVVKGDSLSASIAAASILAKVSRDRVMVELDRRYPQYGFAKHKGYPTKAHKAAIAALGPCPEHRRSYKWT